MNGPVTVQVYPFRADAEIATARLAADGIRSAIRADDEGGLSPGFFTRFGVRLEVDARDLADAQQSLGIESFSLPMEMAQAIFSHALWAYPTEACGLVAMDEDGNPVMVFCLSNTHDSAHRFTIDPSEHFGCVTFAQARGWSIGGVFHSHVRSSAEPSPSDIDGGGDPAWLNIIIGPIAGSSPSIRAFRFDDGFASEVSLTVGS